MTGRDCHADPLTGLPKRLPPGERVLWQGRPERAGIFVNALHGRKIVLYFAALLAWRTGTGLYDGRDLTAIGVSAAWCLALGAVVLFMAWWFARAIERTTLYVITDRRVVMRIGVALPVTFNFPFSQITSADVCRQERGRGVVALSLIRDTRISWLVLWPHVRPWKVARPQPAIRSVANVERVAGILAERLRAAHEQAEARQPVAADRTTTKRRRPVAAGGMVMEQA